MSLIMIQDLSRRRDLDRHALSTICGGSGLGSAPFGPNVNVNLNLDQRIGQSQDIRVNVLNNNGVIGPGFVGPSVNLSPMQWATNNAVVPL